MARGRHAFVPVVAIGSVVAVYRALGHAAAARHALVAGLAGRFFVAAACVAYRHAMIDAACLRASRAGVAGAGTSTAASAATSAASTSAAASAASTPIVSLGAGVVGSAILVLVTVRAIVTADSSRGNAARPRALLATLARGPVIAADAAGVHAVVGTAGDLTDVAAAVATARASASTAGTPRAGVVGGVASFSRVAVLSIAAVDGVLGDAAGQSTLEVGSAAAAIGAACVAGLHAVEFAARDLAGITAA